MSLFNLNPRPVGQSDSPESIGRRVKLLKFSTVKNRLTTALLALLLGAAACSKDFLNTTPLDRIPSEATWSDGALSQAFVFNVYSFLGYGGFEEQGQASITDEAMFTHAGRNINTFTEGSETPGALAWMSPTYEWNQMYLAIRQANVAITNLPTSSFDNDDLRDRLLGESHFLRAFYYHQLMRNYGGVPLVDKAYALNEDYAVARAGFAETVAFIVADLDRAATLLEDQPEDAGRATQMSALALKARVLAYAASDLYDAPTAKAASSLLNGYANIELIANTSGDQASRWRAAQAAAKAVLDGMSGYKLDLSAPVTPDQGRDNYIAMAMGGQSGVADAAGARDQIFIRTLTPDFQQESAWPLGGLHVGINNGPNGYHNWAGNTPVQQLVDDYEMMDGSSFDWSNPAHAKTPYENRDPRFYATIIYDGAKWKPRPSDVTSLDPMDEVQTGFYDDGSGGTLNGIDTRSSVIENWNGSRTHYYTRKFIDPNPSLADNQSNAQTVPWPFIRYTEMALIYAEASYELGEEPKAVEWVNRIRFRAGMPAVNDAGPALLNRIKNERRVELAYEEHRYYDGRRWLMGSELGRPVQAINVRGKLKAGKSALSPYRYDPETYDYEYTVFTNNDNETRVWEDKMYFRPISRDEINRNSLLIQNPGY